MTPSWTQDQITRLTELVSQGQPGSTIARTLNREFNLSLTRNAIRGKIDRLNKQDPSYVPLPSARETKRAAPIRKRKARIKSRGPLTFLFSRNTGSDPETPPYFSKLHPERADYPDACSLVGLTNTSCRFPCGDPMTPEFFFCGTPDADMTERRPYCFAHARIAFQ